MILLVILAIDVVVLLTLFGCMPDAETWWKGLLIIVMITLHGFVSQLAGKTKMCETLCVEAGYASGAALGKACICETEGELVPLP